jgi:RNA polymerase sigma-70 factor (ECF subfamily)
MLRKRTGRHLQNLTDHQLAERCRHGDHAAQREVYDRTSERIYRLLLKITRDPDQAFDLAQDTYVRAFTRMRQFDGRASLATWLYRIAVNEALQFARRQAKAGAKLVELQRRADAASGNGQVATQIDVSEALATLSAEDRAILVLRYQEDLDYAAISEITGCPPGTVASRLNRARLRMRSLLNKDYGVREETCAGEHQMNGTHAAVAESDSAARPDAGQAGTMSP